MTAMLDKTIGFVGAGNMAEALIRGLLRGHCDAARLGGSAPRPERCAELQARYGITMITDNGLCAERSEILVLSVKPQIMRKVLDEIADRIRPDALVVSIAAYASIDTDFDLYILLALDKAAVASGEVWRLWTTTLVHAPPTGGLGILHLGFNMYALYVVGPIVERYYGAWLMLLFYLVFAAAGSIASFVFADNRFSVGASGAIFGLIGLVFVAGRVHHWAFDRRTRAFAGSLGIMVIFNLAIGFANPLIDNAAHLGGLAAGAWLGFLVPPRNMPAGSERDDLERGRRARLRQAIGVVALIGVLVAGLLVGRGLWLA